MPYHWGLLGQQHPTFSRSWFRSRATFYMAPLTLLALVLLYLDHVTQGDDLAYVSSAGTWLATASSLLLGRWLAVQACARGRPARIETMYVVAALGAGTISSVLLFWLTQLRSIQPIMSGAGTTTTLVCAMLFAWWGGWLDLASHIGQRRALKEAARQREIELYREERNAAELRLSILASQIEPHFLFNTLAGVRSAILSDPLRGVAIIDHLVDYLRSSIPRMRDDVAQRQVPLNAELASIRAYLGVIQCRFPRLDFCVEADPDLHAISIPPLMLISLVENAVKHGIEPKTGPVQIAVVARKVADQGRQWVALRVTDNGIGFGQAHSGSGIGLTNIRERLRQLYADQASLVLSQNDAGGVDAQLTIPIEPPLLEQTA